MNNKLIKLITEEFRLLLERRTAEAQPFKRISNDYNSITYEFFSTDIRYEFNLTAKKEGYEVGTYEAVFIKDDQNSSADRGDLGALHFFQVLATCKTIMDIECKEKNIRSFAVEGAKDVETEKTIKRGDNEDNTQRARIYHNYFSDEYPSYAVSRAGRFIVIDMTKVFPDHFDVENSESSTVNTLTKLLMRVSDKKPNPNTITQSFEGNEDKFTISTDELENNQYGGLDLDLYVDNGGKYYKIDYSKFERGESGSEEFNDFSALTQFIQARLFS